MDCLWEEELLVRLLAWVWLRVLVQLSAWVWLRVQHRGWG